MMNNLFMRNLKFLVFYCLCFISTTIFAQTPAGVEANLYKSFQIIDNWRDRQDTIANIDSLEHANDFFKEKLKNFTAQFPFTIDQKFTWLEGDNLYIASAPDGMFRIYSWDTWLGGSMHAFDNVYQVKVGDKTFSDFTPADSAEEGHLTWWYSKLYTFKTNGKTYYLGVYNSVSSNRDAGQGIRIFGIENGKLNNNIKLIKTHSGLHSKLYYDYEFTSSSDLKSKPSIHFDEASNTIFLPLVDGNGRGTGKFITYKFTGQYFEMVKN
jgi:hypothetical protein